MILDWIWMSNFEQWGIFFLSLFSLLFVNSCTVLWGKSKDDSAGIYINLSIVFEGEMFSFSILPFL